MLRHRVPRSTLRVPQALRVGVPPYSFGTVTRSAQGTLNRCRPPDEHIEPVFDTSHLGAQASLWVIRSFKGVRFTLRDSNPRICSGYVAEDEGRNGP